MSNQDQKAISKRFKTRPILYQPGLAVAFGYEPAGRLINQLVYWNGLGRKGDWTYKTSKHLQLETGLSRAQQDKAIAILIARGVLTVKLKSVPATRHFKVDMPALLTYLDSLRKTNKLVYIDATTKLPKNQQSITKSTQLTTTETTVGKNNFASHKRKLIGKMDVR